MSTDLVSWLRSQLDADERVAKRAARMRYDLPSDAPWESARLATERGVPSPSLPLIALGSPAHVLRTVAAHRAILDRHGPGVSHPDECGRCNDPWPCGDVQALASIYNDRR